MTLDHKDHTKIHALTKQYGGTHYKADSIEPIEYIMANKLEYPAGSVVKYVSRYRKKGKDEDLFKAIHYIQMILEDEYGILTEMAIRKPLPTSSESVDTMKGTIERSSSPKPSNS